MVPIDIFDSWVVIALTKLNGLTTMTHSFIISSEKNLAGLFLLFANIFGMDTLFVADISRCNDSTAHRFYSSLLTQQGPRYTGIYKSYKRIFLVKIKAN